MKLDARHDECIVNGPVKLVFDSLTGKGMQVNTLGVLLTETGSGASILQSRRVQISRSDGKTVHTGYLDISTGAMVLLNDLKALIEIANIKKLSEIPPGFTFFIKKVDRTEPYSVLAADFKAATTKELANVEWLSDFLEFDGGEPIEKGK